MNVPKLRFKEFNESYNIKEINEITYNVASGKISKPVEDGNYNIYGSMGKIGTSNFYDYEGEKVLVARVGANAGSVNKINEKCCISDNTLVLEPKDVLNDYLYYSLKHYNPQKLIFGSGQPLVTGGQLKKIKLGIPGEKEQLKVANFLSLLDKKIELQTKKIEDLKLFTKKLETQYIFNKQIEYSKKRIDDIFTVKAGGDISKTNVSFVKTPQFCYPIYSNNLEMNGLYGYSDIYKINEESITVTGRGDIGKAIKREGKYYPIVRLLVLIPKMDINLIYMQEAINNLTLIQESTGVPQLTAPQISRYEIHFPPLYIQEKYGKMLYLLQEKTMKELRKIEVLKQLKKGLIQNMFV